MKAVFITYNQVWTDELYELLDELHIRGFTQWSDVRGRGSTTGEPRMGSHTWPAMNGAMICIVNAEQEDSLLSRLRKMDEASPEQGLRAFSWRIDEVT